MIKRGILANYSLPDHLIKFFKFKIIGRAPGVIRLSGNLTDKKI